MPLEAPNHGDTHLLLRHRLHGVEPLGDGGEEALDVDLGGHEERGGVDGQVPRPGGEAQYGTQLLREVVQGHVLLPVRREGIRHSVEEGGPN